MMIIQILTHTPIWVFLLFALLLFFGLAQTRTRTVPRMQALLLPAGMIALSFAGILSSFGFEPLPIAAWGLTLLATAGIGHRFRRDTRVFYNKQTRHFSIPGSWTPLTVIMAIFFTKYVFAVTQAFTASITFDYACIGALCAVYGLCSGYFASRSLNLISRAQEA